MAFTLVRLAREHFFQYTTILLIKPYFQIEFYDIDSVDNFKEKLNKANISNYQLYDWRNSNEAFFNAIQTEKNVMFLILSLIIIVAAFNIISSLIMLVKNKQIDIAILRTMGASQNTIMKIFFLNGATIGFFGTLTGTLFGILFVLNINPQVIVVCFYFNSIIIFVCIHNL